MVTDDEVLAFDKADMRNPSVPSGFFSYSMLKVEVLGLQAMIRTIWHRRTFERCRGDLLRAGRNPFSDAAGSMFTAMDNPFA